MNKKYQRSLDITEWFKDMVDNVLAVVVVAFIFSILLYLSDPIGIAEILETVVK
ncbi:hypothetical protein MYX06_02900 [Patescibacteria group bacterium AH-259-L05]|nr:hypothetical protein [Patescibacteria group bacterium AH-259-L05]